MSIETMRSIGGAGFENQIGQIGQAGQAGQAERAVESASGGGFAQTLGSALQKVDQMQLDDDAQAEKVALGGGNLHEMSLSLEKADVAMRLAIKVRNKMVEAYQEIMRMSV